MSSSILICEPQCHGFEHALVNAAMIAVCGKAYPQKTLHFAGEGGHISHVQQILLHHKVKVHYHELAPPKRTLSHIKRLPFEFLHCQKTFTLAAQLGVKAILFSSITDTGLFCQRKLALRHQQILVVNIIHSILQTVSEKAPIKPWKKMVWFPKQLLASQPPNLQFIVLGESIHRHAITLNPLFKERLKAIDHPLFFHSPPLNPTQQPIKIGAIGIGGRSKGTHHLFALADFFGKEIHQQRIDFEIIGPINDKKIRKIPDTVRCSSRNKPLSREQFEKHVADIDYALFLYDSGNYALTASGAFMEAIAFAKPIIALKNPYFEYYFNTFGDIGYLCDSVEQVGDIIGELLINKRASDYRRQVKNIIRGRKKISLGFLGKRLKAIMESAQNNFDL